MFDVFYIGPKPGLFEFEKPVDSLDQAAAQSRTKYCWCIYGDRNYADFDFDFVPAPWEADYLHVWPTQWNQFGGAYLINRHTYQSKQWHFHSQPVPIKADPAQFSVLTDISTFDFTWRPHPFDPPYIYVFGNQWYPSEKMPTVEFRVPGAVEKKFINEPYATLPDKHDNKWHTLIDCEWDYSWIPDPGDPPYIYVFGNQHWPANIMPTVKYTVPGATEVKYMDYPSAKILPNKEHWIVPSNVDPLSVDYSWVPHPGDPAYVYQFPSQYQSASGVTYASPGATEIKLCEAFSVKTLEDKNHWSVPDNIDAATVDFSWHPNPLDPPYVYQFPSQHQDVSGVTYTVPGATEIKLCDSFTVRALPESDNWSVPEEVIPDSVDFSWHPNPLDPPYIYHFGSEYQESVGLTYTVPGATEIKFAGPIPVPRTNLVFGKKPDKVLDVVDIFFIDKGNPTAQVRYERLCEKYKATKVRYANSLMDTIKRCINRAKTTKFWIISSEYSYDNFDFHWHPAPWQHYMTHVFPSQHNKWSDTFLIHKWEFERHSKWAQSLDEFPNLNFVNNQTVVKPDTTNNIYYIDHGNSESAGQISFLRSAYPDMVTTRFVDNYLDTFKRIMSTAETEFVWIINSICDYRMFDFTWEPEPWQKEMIHVFPSGAEKRGDTFYIHVPSFKEQMADLEILDWFNVINYCSDQKLARWVMPEVIYQDDNLVKHIQDYNFGSNIYVKFRSSTDGDIAFDPCIWRQKDRSVISLTRGNSTALVPRDIKASLETQIYDYPHVLKDFNTILSSKPLDIVYISNGEKDEERWYNHLKDVVYGNPLNIGTNRIKWIRGINGRANAYKAAADASSTNWFFAVFAKLEVDADFDWEWQPDYFQQPKHYIFNALNPVTGLEYGHMGMIAYNKTLVLGNNNPGLDFTLTQAHESVPIRSGVAHYNQDAWTTWRTSFREVIKLKYFMDTAPTVETEHRLHAWFRHSDAEFGEWSVLGAQDADHFYHQVNGQYEQLMLSFEWDWLRDLFNRLHSTQ